MEDAGASAISTTNECHISTTGSEFAATKSSSSEDAKMSDVANEKCSTKVEEKEEGPSVTLIAKWGKERIELSSLPSSTTIGQVKNMLTERTGVLPKRQKLIGLSLKKPAGGGTAKGSLTDGAVLSDLKVKAQKKSATAEEACVINHQFILMGTPEEKIFIDPHEKGDLPDVIDDFDLDFTAGSAEWVQHVANGQNLAKFTETTQIHVMNEPREGKPLLVLDLDHTLLDFSSKKLQQAATHVVGDTSALAMKRPFMDEFLTLAYQHYDLVVWSQTSWRWLETKLTELGMLTHSGYRFCFVLDKTSMFSVVSTRKDGQKFKHHVKPMQIIWTKFPRWSSRNTVHVDDLSRNFALNMGSGLKVSAYYRKKDSRRKDCELMVLAKYLEQLASQVEDFDDVDFKYWLDVARDNMPMIKKDGSSKER